MTCLNLKFFHEIRIFSGSGCLLDTAHTAKFCEYFLRNRKAEDSAERTAVIVCMHGRHIGKKRPASTEAGLFGPCLYSAHGSGFTILFMLFNRNVLY